MISILPISGIPIVETTDQFYTAIKEMVVPHIQEGDILVSAHTPWSRVLGYIYFLDDIKASPQAKELADKLEKDPSHVEIILRESNSIVKMGRKVIVTENKAGVTCANGGIDQSNAGIGHAVAVPHDPDALATEIREFVRNESGIDIAVIISDTVGRALRRGAVNIGVGCSGIEPMESEIGKQDLFGYTMRVSQIAIIDELASAAELAQGQTDEATPLVIIRGYDYQRGENSARSLNRPKEERIFQ